ncbi:DNA utilization protein HofM [Salmonella enterica]|uniref:DNA utilization protein HofM n=1 Tax=Salmonella enterica TaxID=28901 RepID=A0A744AFE9_SALER|nr:DNA utilization protein HofM [Salmonella enterica]EBY2261436.1 DNA utilization protein HofM [Salmonella enterica subsp. enterica serovar Newport]EED9895907.1 DNA utilization protein HofM [Salmonella enterica subsp. enterica]EBJ0729610.1 DNA utilization protein HofM [Salmonella enterica]EBQ8104869.1 DNA utilization protein HofM [Salmonella enterica]
MAFKTWQIGLHIQQHEALAIAVIRGASGCSLQRWWRLPLMNASTAEGTIPDPQSLAHVLRPWSRELPLRHRIYLSFPANRTLQRAFPHPPMRLREREQVAWLSQTMARELDMDPDLLRFDFQDDALSPAFNVTAVQSKEISELLTLAQTINVRIAAVTPDACALQRLLPFIPSGRQCLVWRDESQWLWATRYAWGRKSAREATTLHDLAATLSVVPEHISLCAEGEFDPWRAVTVRQPPVPPDGYRFAIALGLAIGEIR